MSTKLTIQATINAPLAIVWKCFNNPDDIVKWNHASDDWHTTRAEIDLRVGGRFSSRMEAKDGSFGFDFGGVYTKVEPQSTIEYKLDDDRMVVINFTEKDGVTELIEVFEAESQNPAEMQQQGWQMILNNFAKYTERVVASSN